MTESITLKILKAREDFCRDYGSYPKTIEISLPLYHELRLEMLCMFGNPYGIITKYVGMDMETIFGMRIKKSEELKRIGDFKLHAEL